MHPVRTAILVGHHSEKRDRRYRDGIRSKMDQGLTQHRKAEHHASKARGLAIALDRSIFDDDPDALERLRDKIEGLEATCQQSKRINAAWRKGGREAVAALMGENLAAAAAKLMTQCPWLRAPMTTTNDRAEIRRCQKRIQTIEAKRTREREATGAGGLVVQRRDEHDWCRVTFAEKPEREVLAALRAAGYRWGGGSWQGKLAKLPAEVEQAEEHARAAAGECLCSEPDAPCEREQTEGAEATGKPDELAAGTGEPSGSSPIPVPPRPCADDCPGWAVMWSQDETGSGFEIQRCDACWSGIENAPTDDTFAEHPACVAELERTERGPRTGRPGAALLRLRSSRYKGAGSNARGRDRRTRMRSARGKRVASRNDAAAAGARSRCRCTRLEGETRRSPRPPSRRLAPRRRRIILISKIPCTRIKTGYSHITLASRNGAPRLPHRRSDPPERASLMFAYPSARTRPNLSPAPTPCLWNGCPLLLWHTGEHAPAGGDHRCTPRLERREARIVYWHVEDTGRHGRRGGAVSVGQHAEVATREWIRLFGSRQGQAFDLAFTLGDEAAYGGYNLTDTGTIIAIGAKTVTIRDEQTTRRLSIYDFLARNWRFDPARVRAEARLTMQRI